jgi:hypothetical protein
MDCTTSTSQDAKGCTLPQPTTRPRATPARNKRTEHCMKDLDTQATEDLTNVSRITCYKTSTPPPPRRSVKKDASSAIRQKVPRQKATFFEEKEEYAPGECLHGDILLMPIAGIRGDKCALFLTDDSTKYVWLYATKTREQLRILIKRIVNLILTQHGTRVKRLRTDNEFITAGMKLLADEYGIICSPSPPYENNFLGVMERTNRTIMNKIRAHTCSTSGHTMGRGSKNRSVPQEQDTHKGHRGIDNIL